jgi:hypothetical protein
MSKQKWTWVPPAILTLLIVTRLGEAISAWQQWRLAQGVIAIARDGNTSAGSLIADSVNTALACIQHSKWAFADAIIELILLTVLFGFFIAFRKKTTRTAP